MDTDKVLFPFVSNDLVEDFRYELGQVWSKTEYEQLLIEAKMWQSNKASEEATKNIQLRYNKAMDCLWRLKAAAGDNEVWWLEWTKGVESIFHKNNFDWFYDNIISEGCKVVDLYFKMLNACEAGEPSWFEKQELLLYNSSRVTLAVLCGRICLSIGKEKLLDSDAMGLVYLQMKALALYIAINNELAELKKTVKIHDLPLEEPAKQEQKEQQTEQEDNRWDTPRARKYFKKAIKAGLMEKTEDGHYRWKRSKKNPKAALGYFLQEVYVCKATDQIPYKSLEKLFGEKRLDSTIGAVDFNKKDQPWKEPIDDLFDD